MKRIWFALVLLLPLSGCTGNDVKPAAAPDPNAVIVDEIKRQMAEMERDNAHEFQTLRASFDKLSKESKSTADDLQQQILLKDQRIEDLENRIQQVQAETRSLKKVQQPTSPITSSFPATAQTDPFPIRISHVKGQKIVTGQHTTVRQVEGNVIGKDAFGEKIKETHLEDVQADDYGYQVSFSAENLTETSVEISVSAGLKTETMVVPAQQVLNDLSVDSAMGADLTITVDSHTQRFPVTY